MLKRLALLLAVLTVLACGGGGSGGTSGGGTTGGTNSGVNLNSNSASLAFNQTFNLVASVPGVSSQTVNWVATGGTITPTSATTATFTSPAAAGTFTITARSVIDTAKFATCIVTVAQVGITIEPDAVQLGPGAKTIFIAPVTGSTNPNVTWTTTGGSIRVLSAGRMEYTAPTLSGNYTVTATAAANTNRRATASITVANVGANAIVQGRAIVDGSTLGVAGASIAFYNSAGLELGRVTTGTDGRFTATIPSTARRFHVVPSSINETQFYRSYEYANFRYTMLVSSCTAPLPTLTAGGTTILPTDVRIPRASDPPPPPPNGCPGF
jgi:hypothetical protein